MKVLVIVDHNNQELFNSTLNVVTAGKQIGSVDLLIFGYKCENVINKATKIEGVSKVYVNDNEHFKNFLAENSAEFIKTFSEPYNHILFSNNSNGKNIAPRLAGLLDVMVIPDVINIVDHETFKRPIYAGNAIATVKSFNKINVLTVRSTNFEESKLIDKKAEVEKLNDILVNETTIFLNSNLTKSERPELTSADIVVSGGRGVGSAENFKILEKLADKLGAAMGASRAAVDAGYVPNDWQVGQTGKIVAPNLYIAVGISGAIQHLAGMKDSKVIVAINKDEEAPIFSISDYGLAQDLFKAIPEMEEKIN